LDRVPESLINYLLLLTGICDSLVNDLASINPVLQEMVECPSTKGAPAEHLTGRQGTPLAPHAALSKIFLQRKDTPQGKVPAENQADLFGLFGIDHQFPVLHVIAERDGASHPHAFATRGRKFIADPLTGELALELGE
jgi:hypothetical protein